MIRLFVLNILLALFVAGCSLNPFSNQTQNTKTEPSENFSFNYYADKSVNSLEVPPDLTSPDIQNSFRVQDIAQNAPMNQINLSNSTKNNEPNKILNIPKDVRLMKSGIARWLSVDKDSETVWQLVRDFLKSHSFTLEKEDKKIGILQTNFLENRPRPKLPKSNLGLVKQMMQDIGSVYSLATLDSYRIRIEPESNERTEIFLTLTQLKETVSKENQDAQYTVFQPTETDKSIETEMLLNLMSFLGGDAASAREKIIEASVDSKKSIVKIEDGLRGYAKLVVNLNVYDTWDNISWALDQIRAEIIDKDMIEKTFYISTARTADIGLMSKFFGDEAIKKTYQLMVKPISTSYTEVYFNDVSELDEKETKEFSYDFFSKLANQFK